MCAAGARLTAATSPKKTVCVPMVCCATSRHSIAATAPSISGTSSVPAVTVQHEKSKGLAVAERPAKVSAMPRCATFSKFTANTPFAATAAFAGLRVLMQTSNVGGSAQTELHALTVTPKRSLPAPVVTTWTDVELDAIESRKAARRSRCTSGETSIKALSGCSVCIPPPRVCTDLAQNLRSRSASEKHISKMQIIGFAYASVFMSKHNRRDKRPGATRGTCAITLFAEAVEVLRGDGRSVVVHG